MIISPRVNYAGKIGEEHNSVMIEALLVWMEALLVRLLVSVVSLAGLVVRLVARLIVARLASLAARDAAPTVVKTQLASASTATAFPPPPLYQRIPTITTTKTKTTIITRRTSANYWTIPTKAKSTYIRMTNSSIGARRLLEIAKQIRIKRAMARYPPLPRRLLLLPLLDKAAVVIKDQAVPRVIAMVIVAVVAGGGSRVILPKRSKRWERMLLPALAMDGVPTYRPHWIKSLR
mmetsp:Transcript_28616/g.52220  ORF Transcript_28616/g.52220 Transcript_28616/m.52220 type:complete len:234 (+) Transcript_28616:386-1087(+)